MRARWLWLLAIATPIVSGAVGVFAYSDTAWALVLALGWPLTAVLAGVATWRAMSTAHWVGRAVGAAAAALAMSLLVAPVLFFASYFFSVVLFGHDDRTYF